MIRLKPIESYSGGQKVLEEVPSAYKIYGKKQKIAWRSLKFSEITDLAEINRKDTFKSLQIYKNAIELIDGDYEHISLHDFIYAQIYVDLETVSGSRQSLLVKCACDKESEHELLPSSLDFHDLADTEYPLYLDFNGRKYMVDVFRIGDLEVRRKLVDSGIKTDIATFACMMRDFEEIDKAVEFVSDLDHESGLALMAIEKEYNHFIKPVVKICPHCKKELNIAIDAEVVDFIPFRRFKDFVGNKIHFNR